MIPGLFRLWVSAPQGLANPQAVHPAKLDVSVVNIGDGGDIAGTRIDRTGSPQATLGDVGNVGSS